MLIILYCKDLPKKIKGEPLLGTERNINHCARLEHAQHFSTISGKIGTFSRFHKIENFSKAYFVIQVTYILRNFKFVQEDFIGNWQCKKAENREMSAQTKQKKNIGGISTNRRKT